ncbi:MAG: GatB/YqeY domain-containing protein [Gammaproteobacteria bacterium]|nr:GatB/YqeY domain-containing protein [Gammaproteobacteria bacterium]
MSSTIQKQVQEQVKIAMRARDKKRLAALRLISADFKKVEVDERIELTDQRILAILDKMTRQRRDSLSQFKEVGRDDLVEQEQLELDVINEFMPDQLDSAELEALIDEAVAETGAESMRDMGKVMGRLKNHVQGRVDMGVVGTLVKSRLN